MIAFNFSYECPSFAAFNSDNHLFISLLAIASFGVLVVASSSIDFAASVYGDAWYFAKKTAVLFVFRFMCWKPCFYDAHRAAASF